MQDLVIAIVVILGLLGGYLYRQRVAEKRTKAVRQAAFKLGMDFFPRDPDLEKEELRYLPLFSKGSETAFDAHSEKPKNVLRGTHNGKKIILFGYKYLVSAGEHSAHTYDQTVAAFRVDLPIFILSPESILGKIGAKMGMHDINFDNYPTFSSSYRLRGEDENEIRRLFQAPILQYFSQNNGWTLEAGGGWLIIYSFSTLIETKDLSDFRDIVTEISDLFDDYKPHASHKAKLTIAEVAKARAAPRLWNTSLTALAWLSFAAFGAYLAYLGLPTEEEVDPLYPIMGIGLLFMLAGALRALMDVRRYLKDGVSKDRRGM